MTRYYGQVADVVVKARAAWKPPPRLSLSEWADREFYLSKESAAEPGRWKTYAYQREIMDAITDPRVTEVTLMKSARVGYTKMVGAAIGYFIEHDPSSIMMVQPTIEDGKGYSKEEIDPMLRDCPALTAIAVEEADATGAREHGNTILHKKFKGGQALLDIIGANSGSGFRRKSRRVVIFDETDAYPPSAGDDGDQILLGKRRASTFWNRKIILGSTPLIAGSSRIEASYLDGDQRRYFVPCTQCGHMAPLVFSEKGGRHGHVMRWLEGKPRDAFFECQANGCVIEHKDKRDMILAGEWRAAAPFKGHASFHIWAAYGLSADAEWGAIAEEFTRASGSVEKLKTFVNTVLGETWKEQGDAPDYVRLYERRERYAVGSVPAGVKFLTCGVDVQKDRFVWEVVGWGAGRQSWSIDCGVIPADTSNDVDYFKLDALLDRAFITEAGARMVILTLGIDSGFNTQVVYNWARNKVGRVIAVKGIAAARFMLGAPTPVDVTYKGKRITRGCKLWPVGVDIIKTELYGWLKQDRPTAPDAPSPPGYCHFPEYGEDVFKQLTAEHLVTTVNKRGYSVREWQQIPGRENHYLDARVYARAAAALAGLDRMAVASPADYQAAPAPDRPAQVSAAQRSGVYLKNDSRFLGTRGKDWLKR